MSKAVSAFRTISEVADELVVQKHVLRFWEVKFPQIRPMKRGGGRRYYRPEDMVLLRGIQHLLHAEGYTIKGVQKILREQGVEQVKVHGLVAIAAAPTKRAVKALAPQAATGSGRVRALPKAAAEKALAAAAGLGKAKDEPLDRLQRVAIEQALRELANCRDALVGAAGRSATAAPSTSQRSRTVRSASSR